MSFSPLDAGAGLATAVPVAVMAGAVAVVAAVTEAMGADTTGVGDTGALPVPSFFVLSQPPTAIITAARRRKSVRMV